MIEIKVKNDESLNVGDVLLLQDKDTGENSIGIVISLNHSFDVVLLEGENKITQWSEEGYSEKQLINSLKDYFTVTKLDKSEYNISIDVNIK